MSPTSAVGSTAAATGGTSGAINSGGGGSGLSGGAIAGIVIGSLVGALLLVVLLLVCCKQADKGGAGKKSGPGDRQRMDGEYANTSEQSTIDGGHGGEVEMESH